MHPRRWLLGIALAICMGCVPPARSNHEELASPPTANSRGADASALAALNLEQILDGGSELEESAALDASGEASLVFGQPYARRTTPTPRSASTCPRDMTLVPAGDYEVSTSGGFAVQHVAQFCIDMHLADDARLQACARAGKCIVPARAGPGAPVSLHHANAAALCAFEGKTLPTEVEWDVAARGGDRRPFPWGAGAPSPASRFGADYSDRYWEWTASDDSSVGLLERAARWNGRVFIAIDASAGDAHLVRNAVGPADRRYRAPDEDEFWRYATRCVTHP